VNLTHIQNVQVPARTGKQYWRSLDDLAETPQFREWLHREFPEGASEMLFSGSRRTLLKLMAASLGLAGLVACRRPEELILPASRGVEDLIPGNPLYYATAMTLGGRATGLMVEAHDGRPTKIEGNPVHPESQGAASVFAQASVLGLYDPDRSTSPLRDGTRSSWEEFEGFVGEHFAGLGSGKGLWIVSEPSSSVSLGVVREHLMGRYPEARWVEFDPVSREAEIAGAELAFGERLVPHWDFSQADVIFSLDADFLGVDSPGLNATRKFARRRDPESMNRLYVAESQFSITGAMADHRFRTRSADIHGIALELLRTLEGEGEPTHDWTDAVARDLREHGGRSAVIAGPRQPAEVHALAYLVNEMLGNAGATLQFIEPATEPGDSIENLGTAMAAGEVTTLVMLGVNPAFAAPADLDFSANLDRVETTIHLGLEVDETGSDASWHLPMAHYLESWGDGRAVDGTVTIQQPLIQPLYGGKTSAEVLALVTGYPDQRAYDIVRNYWQDSGLGEREWRQAMRDGVVAGSAFELRTPVARREQVLAAAGTPPAAGGIEAVFVPSASVWDGRFANNGWLQELPDPMTKMTWDNAALMAPATATSLGVGTGDVVRLETAGRSIEMPVWVMPGQAEDSIALELGYGRKRCGRVGNGVGHDVYPLRSSSAQGFVTGVTVTATGRSYQLVSAQDHHSMEGRPLVREGTLEHYHEEPDFAQHAVHLPELESLYEHPRDYSEGYQWGIAVDLNACTGCNACVVACQAENNIPIVGKQEVARGREMHWIRLDRYFTGDEAEPQAVVQPVACHHCENAPCENVCPVAATAHSPDGLNEMTYNRCVGTRYCSNNCPYKVRRFNFLAWHQGIAETEKMVFNPDVTVRMRGVMEKCTYCVQRIREKEIEAKADGRREIRDGEIVTACQQTCPTGAIVFGNINDQNSKVSQLKREQRDYEMLAELNVKPRTSYLARLRNPNPELERIPPHDERAASQTGGSPHGRRPVETGGKVVHG